MTEKPIVVDLFCGAGGLSLGFENAGFQVAFATDIHSDPLETYKHNRKKIKDNITIVQKDIQELKGNEIKRKISKILKSQNEVDVVMGGSPCQGFSIRGKNLRSDPRNSLAFEFFRIIKEIKPKIFVFENVSGLLNENNREILLSMTKTIEDLGYHFALDLLNASDYGVPQTRKRLIIVGSKSNETIIFPKKSKNITINQKLIEQLNMEIPKYDVVPIIKKKVKSKEALSDIAFSVVRNNPINHTKKPQNYYQEYIRNKFSKIYNHVTTNHKESTVKVFKKFKQGNTMRDIPKEYRNKRTTVQKIISNKPVRTITSCNEDFIHYSENRIITIREMARLQSFPDSYIFYGTPTTGGSQRKISCCQVQQIGNSVPPLLAQAIGEGILKMLGYQSNNDLRALINRLNS